jgi:short-subunit dehydrogenase
VLHDKNKNKTVNNVGLCHEFPTDFLDTSPEELATIINVNVTATLRITSLIAPSMASRFVSSSSLGVVS